METIVERGELVETPNAAEKVQAVLCWLALVVLVAVPVVYGMLW